MEAAIISMTIVLGLTILMELLAFWLFIKKRVPKKNHGMWVVFIIGLNLFSNPLAQIVFYSLSLMIQEAWSWVTTEVLVIITEALLIRLIMQETIKRSLIFSILLNGSSILGELVLWVI